MAFVIRVDVVRPGKQAEILLVHAARAVVGSAAHCDVRLAVEEAAPEQALVEIVAGAVRVAARASAPPMDVDGHRVREGAVSWGTDIAVGEVRLRVSLGETADEVGGSGAAAGARAAASRRSLLLRAGIVVAVLALASMWLLDGNSGRRPARVAPQLWSNAAATCPAQDPREAEAAATSRVAIAAARAQRHPFHLSEGVEAVDLYQVATACFSVAGLTVPAAQANDEARELRTEIDADYRVRRLRLEYALRRRDTTTAIQEVVLLRELLAGKQGEYVRWLDGLARKMKSEKDPT